ncbi:hypothetical protein FRB98_008863 [Tulasnella sp. 332]|nr:hypothetical protein FRB98_008863 [Tulasnella sp. 332]
MVGRLNDTRLLENLVKSEKDYYAALINLLALSHSSVASLTGYGSTLNPACSQAVLGVAECLTSVDDGLRSYAESIDDWREKLGEIKRLDIDIETAMRDREILVTRLIKVSKQKPKGSQTNLGKSGSKLSQAQAELQACEAHLTSKQRELDDITRSAVKDGLEKRCHALETCGLIFTDKGREGLKVLEALSNETNSPLPSPHPPYSNLSRPYFGRLENGNTSPRSLDSESSLAPSQSASQIATNPNASNRPSEDTHITTALSNNGIHNPLPLVLPTYVGPSHTNGNFTDTATKDSPVNNLISLNSRPNSYHLDSIHDRAIVPTHEPELRPVAEGDTDDAAVEEDLGSSESGSDDDGPVEVHENPVRAVISMATVVPNVAAAEKVREDVRPQITPKRSMGKVETAVLYPALNGSSRTRLDQTADGDAGPRRVATMDEDRTPKQSKVSHLLHRSEGGGSQRTAQAPPPPRSESPSPARKRAGSGSFFSGIKSFFNPGRGSSARAASPTKSRQRDSSPPPPMPNHNDKAEAPGGAWKTRTDKNLKEGKAEMIVGSAKGAISSGVADSSSDEDGTTRRKRKSRGGGTLVMRNNNNVASKDRDVMGNPVTGPSITGGGGMFDQGAGTLSWAPTKKGTQGSKDAGLDGGTVVQRNVSRRSSDGALQGPNSTATTKGDANGDRRSKSNLASGSGTAAANEITPTPVPPLPRKSPLRTNSSEIATRRAASGGGKIRKRGPAKQFDDGLGSAGGALIVGAQQPKPAASAMASGNESFGGMGLPASAAVSRATSTVRSTAAGAAVGGRGHQRKASDEVAQEKPSPVPSPSPTTTTMFNVSPPRVAVGSGAGVSRNSSMTSRTSNVSGKARGPGNNLMSIIEAPSTGIGPKQTSSPVMLEIVRAPGSVTGPQAPILELPSSSSLPNLPPHVPAKDSPRTIAPSGPPKLILPSEMRTSQTPASASTATLRASDAEPRRYEALPASGSTSRREKHNSVPSALAPPPLRSALRTRSPSPGPSSSSNDRLPTGSMTNLLAATAPLSIFATPIAPAPETRTVNDKDDTASMSSYETGHENLEEPVAHAYEHAAGHGLLGPIVDGPPPPKKGGTDLSTSVETDSTSQPRRRKSVRMALPPSATSTPAVTPAALEQAEANSYMGYVSGVPTRPAPAPETMAPTRNYNGGSDRRSRLAESPTPRDVWDEEDSDAGGDYGEVRKALQKATDDLAKAGRKKHSAAA